MSREVLKFLILDMYLYMFFFFFSSRRRHTRLQGDWSSDVCSSDLVDMGLLDRIEFADGTHRYRVCGGTHHHHLTCTHCHRVVEIDICLPQEQLADRKSVV